MGNRFIAGIGLIVALTFSIACWKAAPREQLVIEIPPGYSGPVEVQLGVAGAPPLLKNGDSYLIAVPPDGRVSTSTSLSEAKPLFKNVQGDHVWGYTSLILRTGDGIPVGGSIEFFVGRVQQYQIEVARKHKSHVIEPNTQQLLALSSHNGSCGTPGLCGAADALLVFGYDW